MTIEWTPAAVASARRYIHDQPGIHTIGAAIEALADDPYPDPPAGFHRGRYHRLRAGDYRIMYLVDEAVITIERVDRLARLYRSTMNPAQLYSPSPRSRHNGSGVKSMSTRLAWRGGPEDRAE